MGSAEPFEAQLRRRIEHARELRSTLRMRIHDLEQQRHAVERRLRAAEELYRAEFGHHAAPTSVDAEGRYVDMAWREAVIEVLREATEPMHVREIWQRLRAGGFRTDAQDPLRSLAAIAVRTPALQKASPNTFVLRHSDNGRVRHARRAS